MNAIGSGAERAAELFRAPIETRRLILRPPAADDLVAVCRLVNDPVIARHTGFIRYPYPPISAWQWLESAWRVKGGRQQMPYLLTLRSNPRVIAGAAGITLRQGGGAPSIGYWVARAHRGRGFATEASRALISALFSKTDVPAVAATARTVNIASQRVLMAAGMTKVGRGQIKSAQLGSYVPVIAFRIDRKSWEITRKTAAL
jgi:RimJ/RimL family protein N-acetyltransferase